MVVVKIFPLPSVYLYGCSEPGNKKDRKNPLAASGIPVIAAGIFFKSFKLLQMTYKTQRKVEKNDFLFLATFFFAFQGICNRLKQKKL